MEISFRNLKDLVRGVALMVLYVVTAGEKGEPKRWTYRCWCGRKYPTYPQAMECDHGENSLK